MEEPEGNMHHAFNNLEPYDVAHTPIFPETDHFSYDHINHYDEGHTPITPLQSSGVTN